MKHRKLLACLLLLTVAVLPATVGSCYNAPAGFGYDVYSTNDDLVEDVFELLFGEEDDD